MKKIHSICLTVILFCLGAVGQNLPNINTGTKGQLPVSRLLAGTSGTQCLFTDSLIVFWATCTGGSGSGTVTSLSSGSLAPIFTASVTNPTTTPSLAYTLNNASAHTFLGNNTGVLGAPNYVSITAADLPGSGTVTVNTSSPLGGGGSLALGGSISLTCVSCVASIPQLAVTKTGVTSNWIRSYDSITGLFGASQPVYSDISGTPQLAITKSGVASNWINSYSSVTGLFTATQPATSDLSDFPSQATNSGKFLTTNGTVLSWAAASGGSGTVTSFSSGNLSPLFTTSVATATTTPAQSFSLSTAAAHSFFGNNTASTAAPGYQAIGNGDLPGTGAITLNTTSPLGGGGSVALGASLTFTCTTCLTSVTAHNLLSATHGDTTTHSVLRGDLIAGIGAVPTWTAVAKGGTNAYPKWNSSGDVIASTLAASGIGSPTTCTNQAVTAFTLNADAAPTSTCTTLTSAFTSGTFPATAHNLLSATHGDTTPGSVVTGDVISGQSSTWARLAGNSTTTPQYLKSLGSGAAATAPSWAQVAYTDLSGVPSTFAPTAHNILSTAHGDTTAAAAVRGDGFFAIGATPTWQRLAHSATSGGYFKWNGTDVVASSLAASGTGSCAANQFETANNADAAPTCAQPSFTNLSGSVAAGQMPALTGDITSTAGTVATTLATVATPGTSTKVTFNAKGLVTSGASAVLASADYVNQGTTTTLLHGNAAGNPSFTGVNLVNDTSANQGTVNQLLHGNAAGQPSFSAVASADLNITTSTCTNQFVSAISSTGIGTCTTDTLASAQHANQGTVNTVLHGNAAGNPAFSAVTSADTTGTFTATAHNLLSATHGDSTTGTVARGDVITGQGASPTWSRLAKGTANQLLAMDGTGTDVVWAAPPGGTGTVTSFSAGTLPPIFTTSVATATTTPALTFNMTAAAAHTFLMNNTGGSASPGYQSPGKSDLPATAVYTDQSNTYSASTNQSFDAFTAKYPGNAATFDLSMFTGADWCAKHLTLYADALFLLASRAIIDSTHLTGSQTCASGGATILSPSTPIHDIWGQMTLSLPTAGVSFLEIAPTPASAAAPTAPTLSTSTSGGSLAAATTYGVKITLVNLTGETLPSAEATKLTGAGSTNSITVPTPTAGAGSTIQCYNVYSTATAGSGWKLNNTTGCISLGVNYVIKTVGAGAIPPTTGTASEGWYEFEGQGDSTIISEDSTNSPLLAFANNVYMHHFKVVSTQTTNNNGSIWLQNANDVTVDHVTCAGGGHCVFVSSGTNRINISNIHYGNPTISGSAVAINGPASNIAISKVTVANSVWPAGGNLQGAVAMNGCTDCSIDGVQGKNLDFSNLVNGELISIIGSSLRVNVRDVTCDGLINADGVLVGGMSLDVNISDVHCANTAVGTGAGIGTNTNNGDAIDINNAGRVNVVNATCQSMGAIGGLTFPCYEIFDSAEVSLTNVNAYDSSGEGVRLFGSPGTTINGGHFNRNGKSGIQVEDSTTTVTCNNTTTVTYVSGNGFGPWPAGTTVNIGAGPTPFQLASTPTSVSSLTLTAACNLGASQAFSVYSQDTDITGVRADDNGKALLGANTQSGISLIGHSQANIHGGGMNDNRATASKTQQWGISVTPAGGQAARAKVFGADFSSNLGATCSGTEFGAAVAGNHGMCDGNKLSVVTFEDNFGEILYSSNRKRLAADTASLTSTQTTFLSWNIGPSFSQSFTCEIYYTAAATTAALRLDVTTPTSAAQQIYASIYQNTGAVTPTTNGTNTSGTTLAGAVVNASGTIYTATIKGTVDNSTTGGLISVQAGTAASSVIIKKDSVCNVSGS